MPELPEVEIIRIGLEKYLVGHAIADVEICSPSQFTGDPKLIIGAKIVAVRRLGKGLIIDFDNGYGLAVHLKMTGQLIYRGDDTESTGRSKLPDKWTRVVFKFKFKNVSLYFNDVRKFGWIKVLKTEQAGSLPFFKLLGLEPLKNLSLEKFTQIVSKGNLPIKALLMDQRRIAGIGNIYANEALYEANISPKRAARSLSIEEIKSLFEAIEQVLRKAICEGGASDVNFVNALGEKGNFQKCFRVYKRAGEKCGRCGGEIERMKIGGRGTFYCPVCQH